MALRIPVLISGGKILSHSDCGRGVVSIVLNGQLREKASERRGGARETIRRERGFGYIDCLLDFLLGAKTTERISGRRIGEIGGRSFVGWHKHDTELQCHAQSGNKSSR